jgi:hypothetical protein
MRKDERKEPIYFAALMTWRFCAWIWRLCSLTAYDKERASKAIEHHTAKLAPDIFLRPAFGSMAASLALLILDKNAQSNFVGEWVPSMLILGLSTQFLKVAGSDWPVGRCTRKTTLS